LQPFPATGTAARAGAGTVTGAGAGDGNLQAQLQQQIAALSALIESNKTQEQLLQQKQAALLQQQQSVLRLPSATRPLPSAAASELSSSLLPVAGAPVQPRGMRTSASTGNRLSALVHTAGGSRPPSRPGSRQQSPQQQPRGAVPRLPSTHLEHASSYLIAGGSRQQSPSPSAMAAGAPVFGLPGRRSGAVTPALSPAAVVAAAVSGGGLVTAADARDAALELLEMEDDYDDSDMRTALRRARARPRQERERVKAEAKERERVLKLQYAIERQQGAEQRAADGVLTPAAAPDLLRSAAAADEAPGPDSRLPPGLSPAAAAAYFAANSASKASRLPPLRGAGLAAGSHTLYVPSTSQRRGAGALPLPRGAAGPPAAAGLEVSRSSLFDLFQSSGVVGAPSSRPVSPQPQPQVPPSTGAAATGGLLLRRSPSGEQTSNTQDARHRRLVEFMSKVEGDGSGGAQQQHNTLTLRLSRATNAPPRAPLRNAFALPSATPAGAAATTTPPIIGGAAGSRSGTPVITFTPATPRAVDAGTAGGPRSSPGPAHPHHGHGHAARAEERRRADAEARRLFTFEPAATGAYAPALSPAAAAIVTVTPADAEAAAAAAAAVVASLEYQAAAADGALEALPQPASSSHAGHGSGNDEDDEEEEDNDHEDADTSDSQGSDEEELLEREETVLEWATERVRIRQLYKILSQLMRGYDAACRDRIMRTTPDGYAMFPSLFLLTEQAFMYATTTLSQVLLDLTLTMRALHLARNVWE
jgi:hypothetical protein